ncbi:Imm53 family immunity protein [Promicromonospora sp. NPDC019610]|uniref:Imm53 family immunity protein n=1 Tax=Promicromonospora sp. NPDC019610 TaxID=3364405 RepID=UPI003796555E
MTRLNELQEWYALQCDGDWEHSFGVKVDTVDNPEWVVSVDIVGTPIAGSTITSYEEFPYGEWLRIDCDGKVFGIGCGPRSLDRGVAAFLEFAGRNLE